MMRTLTLNFLSLLVGLCFGSFGNVCILRLPLDESIRYPASHCPSCSGALRWYDNIPVISFLWLKGRCRHCHAAISWQYPLVELLIAALFVFSVWRFSSDLVQIVLFDV